MGKKYDLVTAMDMCADCLVQLGGAVPKFGQKEKIVKDYNITLGGSCAIFACQSAKLGLKTAGVGVVGDDFLGRFLLDSLGTAGVSVENIRTDSSMKTAIGVALCKDDGDRSILTYPSTIDAVVGENLTDEIIRNTRHIHIGSFYLMNNFREKLKDIVIKASRYGVTISLDTNWDPEEKWDGGIWDILPYIDIFMPNENEALAITKKASIDEAMEVLKDIVPIIVLKRGKNGASAYANGKFYNAASLEVSVVDTVGAGDSFDGGFIYGFLSNYDIEKCLTIGCICGSYNTTKAGGIEGQINIDKLNDVFLLSPRAKASEIDKINSY